MHIIQKPFMARHCPKAWGAALALSYILRRCGLLVVRLTPQDLLALILDFLLCHPIFYEFIERRKDKERHVQFL
ncbi:MAG: hypothetical protein NTU74_18385 [Deltaproteobacteria bacterium]|nr:hypothetical protein [Deltaproteobacteria bacterium]